MRILYLDLASHDGLLAIAEDQMMASIQIDYRIDDATLVPLVEDVLKKARWSYQDLTHIACVVGPGGFTSLRVVVVLVNTLAHALKIPSCGVHLSEIYELRIADYGLREKKSEIRNPKSATCLWLHSTKKNGLFIRGFGDLQKQFPEPVCITVDNFKNILNKDVRWMGELIPEHQKIVDDAGAGEVELKSLEDVLPLFLKQQTYKEQILTPWYGRGW